MSAFAPEEYQAHLTIATNGLTVSRLEVLDVRGHEEVRALVQQVVPVELLAWTSETDLHAQLQTRWPYLRAGAPALPERLELTSKEVSLAALLHRPLGPTEIEEIFQIDDEAVRVRVAALRRNIDTLLG